MAEDFDKFSKEEAEFLTKYRDMLAGKIDQEWYKKPEHEFKREKDQQAYLTSIGLNRMALKLATDRIAASERAFNLRRESRLSFWARGYVRTEARQLGLEQQNSDFKAVESS